jgi:hypothetical protein
MKDLGHVGQKIVVLLAILGLSRAQNKPLVINTWNFTNATIRGKRTSETIWS